MFGTTARQAPKFSELHTKYVKDLYRSFLRNSLNWHIRRDVWRQDAMRIRAEFEDNRNVQNPRLLASILKEAEKKLMSWQHPDPYKHEEKTESLKDQRV
ncbi:hypothetical protein MVES_002643 [Malassezia vespertilionis]|uniref:NADH dehydrogenase [ubiquinone] 1 beta subcomplex subunit 9 n=1 Tax=Malassezia vespertilionis TaxID=2020962 RepID=A0A2N1JAA5_9BASI|nr:hypothetical protein MVES_002643 [Malassezia vespertilionis]